MQAEFIQALGLSVASARERIERLRKADSFVFLAFSDLHTKTADCERVEKLLSALEAADRAISPDAVVNLGDNPDMLGRNEHITNDKLSALFTRLFDRVQAAVRCPLLLVHGNHDAPGTDFFKPGFWNSIVKGRYGHDRAVYSPEGAYCYLDIPGSRTRLVILSMPFESDLEAQIPTPLWRFGVKQLQWLASEALDTPYQVILLAHVPFFYDYYGDTEKMLGVWTGDRAAESYIKDLCGEIADRDTAVAILNAFQNHEAYTCDELGIRLKASPASASLAACFSGHTHKDSFWLPGQTQGKYTNHLPCHQVVIKTATINYDDQPHLGVSLDAVVWTPSEGSFHLFRIGDGEDRAFRTATAYIKEMLK